MNCSRLYNRVHFSSVVCSNIFVPLFRSNNFLASFVLHSIAYLRRFPDHNLDLCGTGCYLLPNECSLPSGPCSRFRATLHARRVSGQENGIIPNQITTCAGHLKHSRPFLFQSRAVISRRERGTGEKTQSDRKVYCRSISKRSFPREGGI